MLDETTNNPETDSAGEDDVASSGEQSGVETGSESADTSHPQSDDSPSEPSEDNSDDEIDDPRFAGKGKKDIYQSYKELESKLHSTGAEANFAKKIVARVAKEQGLSQEAAKEYLMSLTQDELAGETQSGGKTASQEAPTSDHKTLAQLKVLQRKVEKSELLESYPEAKANLDALQRIAEATDRSMKEVFEQDFQQFVAAGRDAARKSQEKKGQANVVTTNRQSPKVDRTSEMLQQARDSGNEEVLHAAVKERLFGKRSKK